MKIYELEPNKEYKDTETNICYMIDISGAYAGKSILASTQSGLWDYCDCTYTELLQINFEPV